TSAASALALPVPRNRTTSTRQRSGNGCVPASAWLQDVVFTNDDLQAFARDLALQIFFPGGGRQVCELDHVLVDHQVDEGVEPPDHLQVALREHLARGVGRRQPLLYEEPLELRIIGCPFLCHRHLTVLEDGRKRGG